MRILKFIPLLAAFVLIVAACNHSDSAADTTTTTGTQSTLPTITPGTNSLGIFRASLRTVDSCDALLTHFKTEALKLVGPYGLGGGGGFYSGIPEARGTLALDSAAVAPGQGTPSNGSGGFSTTNVQVEGVDEPDIVKTDGRRIVGVSSGELWVVNTAASPAEKTGSLILSTDYDNIEILLYRNKVLAFLTSYSYSDYAATRLATDISSIVRPTDTQTHVIEIDISSSTPEILNELMIEGRYISARQVGNTVNFVVQSQKSNNLGFVYPSNSNSNDRATRINREIIQESVLADWLPTYNLVNEQDEEIQSGTLAPCNAVHIPNQFSGLDLLSIVTVDLDASLPSQSSASIIADGDTIYSSGDTLYVAHRIYNNIFPIILEGEADDSATTDNTADADTSTNRELTPRNEVWFHKFATPAGEPANYQASGSVQGDFLNQFSMHETPDEHFWIVTTDTTYAQNEDGNERFVPPTTESFVNSFRQDGRNLVSVGRVGNLGRDERVQSVRFIGTKAYVVTFRQIDPFYVVDLRVPANPVVAGELKIPGFSSYLHPLGNDQLLGVGSSADSSGRVTGGKLSLFDASDPARPTEVKVLELGAGYTNVAWDHKAFLYWDPANRLVLPFDSYRTNFYGAIVVRLNPSSTPVVLSEAGRFEHTSIRTRECEEIFVRIPEQDSGIDSGEDSGTDSGTSEPDSGTSEPDSGTTTAFPSECRFSNNESISRNIVIDGTLWSLSPNYLEARNLSDLEKTDALKVTDSVSVNIDYGSGGGNFGRGGFGGDLVIEPEFSESSSSPSGG